MVCFHPNSTSFYQSYLTGSAALTSTKTLPHGNVLFYGNFNDMRILLKLCCIAKLQVDM